MKYNMNALKQIQNLRDQRERLMETLLNPPPMIRGTFGTLYVKCGGANCKCSKGNLHPYNRLTWSENGRPQSRVVPVNEINWVKEMTQNYRQHKMVKKEMENLENQLKKLMARLEIAVVENTRKSKNLS